MFLTYNTQGEYYGGIRIYQKCTIYYYSNDYNWIIFIDKKEKLSI